VKGKKIELGSLRVKRSNLLTGTGKLFTHLGFDDANKEERIRIFYRSAKRFGN